jgi:integrase
MDKVKRSGDVYWVESDHAFRFAHLTLKGVRAKKNVPRTIVIKEEAEAWRDSAVAYYSNNGGRWPAAVHVVMPEVPKRTLRTEHGWWNEYNDNRTGDEKKSPSTLRNYKGHVDNHLLKDPIADLAIDSFTPQLLRDWVRRMSKGKSANHAANIAETMRRFIADMRGESRSSLAVNPMNDEIVKAVIPSRENIAGKGVIVHLPQEDAIALVTTEKEIPDFRRVRHLFALTTGCREGEICGLIWANVHLDDVVPWVWIEQQVTECLDISPPRNNSLRAIVLCAGTVLALRWLKKDIWEQFIGKVPTDEDAVFPLSDGTMGRPKSAQNLRIDLLTAGLPDKYKGKHPIDAHATRRSFATMLADARVDSREIGILMGHSAATVTDKHYTARNLDRFVGVIEKLPVELVGWVPAHPNRSRFRDLNPRPAVYETAALPLS